MVFLQGIREGADHRRPERQAGVRKMVSVSWVTSRRVAILVVVGMGLAAAACTTPYQYSGNRPVALSIGVNSPGPMSPAGAR